MFASTTSSTGGITDPTFLAWVGIISLALAVIGLIVTFWLYRKGRRLKLITYEITSDTPVVSVSQQVERDKIKISYQDKSGHLEEIADATLVTLTVRNAGTEDVRIWGPNEVDTVHKEIPIEFEFNNREVVSLTKVKTNPEEDVILPEDLTSYLNQSSPAPNQLGLPACVLQKGQSIELAVLLKGDGKEIKAKGKLFNGDIKNLQDIARQEGGRALILTLIGLLVGATSAAFLITLPFIKVFPTSEEPIVAIFLLISSIIFFVIYSWSAFQLFKYVRQRRRNFTS